jgi:predicted glycosyltransferase involved in capsule biosynthesis
MQRDGFARLASLASAAQMGRFSDVVLTMPAMHLSEARTEEFFRHSDAHKRSQFLQRVAFYGVSSARYVDFEFIAPYSNNFLCRRELFDRVGGYSDAFRGHGSEDFEFFIRYALVAGHLPIPKNFFGDFYGPLKASYYGTKPYEGFRRLLELMTLPSEMAGLRAIHLYHPTAQAAEWVEKNDWKRASFNAVTSQYAESKAGILKVDSLPRQRRFLCVVKHAEHWSYFLPLRSAGIRLIPVVESNEVDEALASIERGEVDGLAVFNPYMKSHVHYLSLFEAARDAQLETIVVERGALPGSLYYAGDVSYNDPEFLELELDSLEFSETELKLAESYTRHLRLGGVTLEENEPLDGLTEKYAALRAASEHLVFIPLQLSDDMAVTQYTEGKISYADFVASIDKVAALESRVTYLVKKHPLSNQPLSFTSPNVVICADGDNVHGLIEFCDATVCYNSGVGVLALAHGKPVFTIGNAYYLAKGRLGTACADLNAAAQMIATGESAVLAQADVLIFFAWLLLKKYSFFTAKDQMSDFGIRKAHGYSDIRVEIMRLKGETYNFETGLTEHPFGANSYAAGHLGIALGDEASGTRPVKSHGSLQRRLRKFFRDPGGFFKDSRFSPLRALGSGIGSK